MRGDLQCMQPLEFTVRNFKEWRLSRDSRYPDLVYKPVKVASYFVPCGKCLSCLKRKQNDYAVLIYRTALAYKSLHFLTFTYRPSNLPLYVSARVVDPDTGEIHMVGKPSRLPDHECSDVRYRYFSRSKRVVKYNQPFCDHEFSLSSGKLLQYCVTPSLCRRDFQLWLKRSRIQFERYFGSSLPDFKYVAVGEYGPNTHRPHMHICLMGLKDSQVNWLCQRWRKEFGFVDCRHVPFINPYTGVSGDDFKKVAKYVGKYISKGEFESSNVLEGYVERPRKMSSSDLGCSDPVEFEQVRSFHLGFDILGCPYDPAVQDSRYEDNKFLSKLADRLFMQVGTDRFAIPLALRKKIYYMKIPIYDKEKQSYSSRYVSTPLSRALSAFIRVNLLEDRLRELGISEVRNRISENSTEFFPSLIAQRRSLFEARQSRLKEDFKAFYGRSVF